MSKQKELFQEDVEETLDLLKKKISKEQGTLDRHIIKKNALIKSMEEERELLEKLYTMLPELQPELIKSVNEGEK
ncbi:hypothetical protein LCGC14_2842890 [marine sediment metagenome]|uniref:Uncharacterized protein n=1 Tax=marine sediment metagenome TaxID=412755 RepID=A0A0F8YAU6_9ZZZZ